MADHDLELKQTAATIRQAITDGNPRYGQTKFALAVAALLDELAGDILTASKNGTPVETTYAATLAVVRAAEHSGEAGQ